MILQLDVKDNNLTVSLTHEPGKKPSDVRAIKVDDFENKIAHQATWIPNSILPPAVRYADMNKGIFIFERPPTYVSFNFSPFKQQQLAVDGQSKQNIRLPIPWQQYAMRLGRNGMPAALFVFFSNEPLQSLDQTLHRAPIPNLYGDGSVCLPVYSQVDDQQMSIVDAISNAYTTVWQSGFNVDVYQCAYDWAQNARMRKHPLASGGINFNQNMLAWYQRWSTFSLESIVENMSWECPIYNGVHQVIARLNADASDHYHEALVDLYLASR